jgi:hypothetical protein
LIGIGGLLVAYALADHPFYGGEPGYGKFEWAIGATGAVIAFCALLPTRLGESVLLLLLSSAFALGVAEFGAERVLGPRYRPIYQADDDLIFTLIPRRVAEFTQAAGNGGATVSHRINSAGFRGAELLPTGAATRVVVYGDSFIHAFYTSDEATFVTRLGEHLSMALGRQVETVNAGVSSYGPDQISLKMERELPQLRPDLAVVAIFAGNDFGDLLRNKLFQLTPEGQLAARQWILDPSVRAQFAISQRESILKRVLRDARRSWSQQSESGGVYDVTAMLDEAEHEYRSYQQDNVVTNTHVDIYSADVSLTPERESARFKVRLMAAVLARIRDVAARNDTPLFFVLIPHPGDLPGGYDAWHIDRSRFPQYDGRRQTAALEDAVKTMGVPYLNLYDVFGAHDPNALYLHNDDHWNEAGQELAAEGVGAAVLKSGMLSRSP